MLLFTDVCVWIHVCAYICGDIKSLRTENLEAVFLWQTCVDRLAQRAAPEASAREGGRAHVLFHRNRAKGSLREFLERLWISPARTFVSGQERKEFTG